MDSTVTLSGLPRVWDMLTCPDDQLNGVELEKIATEWLDSFATLSERLQDLPDAERMCIELRIDIFCALIHRAFLFLHRKCSAEEISIARKKVVIQLSWCSMHYCIMAYDRVMQIRPTASPSLSSSSSLNRVSLTDHKHSTDNKLSLPSRVTGSVTGSVTGMTFGWFIAFFPMVCFL